MKVRRAAGRAPRLKERGRAGLPLPGVILVAATLVAVLVAITALAAAYSPLMAARVPLAGQLLSAVAPLLPADVAWMHDRGTPHLVPGAYFGWSDGVRGELHVYGEGCSVGQGAVGRGAAGQVGPARFWTDRGALDSGAVSQNAGNGGVARLTLSGRGGSLELPPGAITQLWTQLDRARGHPHLRLEVVTDRTVEFDRAHLRCRDGTEAAARILATVHHVPPSQLVWRGTSPPLVVDPVVAVPSSLPPEAEPQPVINGPSSLPGAGKIAELTLVAGTEPLSAVSLLYAPRGVATGEVLAAAGRPDSLPYWRRQAAGLQAPWVEHPPLPELTGWDSAYQSPDDPRALTTHPAADLDLPIARGEFGALFLYQPAFRTTPTPRPLLLKPLLELEEGGRRATVVTSGLAFGWTATP